jgi:cell division septation protein DedD
MSNRQVVAIFITGLALLLGAFWAGMSLLSPAKVTAPTNSHNQAHAPAQTPAQPEAKPPATETQYIVFVAAFGTLASAKQMEAQLHADKYLAAHVKSPSNQDTLYRVNVGPYSKADADTVASQLSTKYRGVMILPWTQN